MAVNQAKTNESKDSAKQGNTESAGANQPGPQDAATSTGASDLHESFATAYNQYFKGFQQAQLDANARSHDLYMKYVHAMNEAQHNTWQRYEEANRNYARALMDITGVDEEAMQKRIDAQQAHGNALQDADRDLALTQENLRERHEQDLRQTGEDARERMRVLLQEYVTSVAKTFGRLASAQTEAADILIVGRSVVDVAAHSATVLGC